ncbi:MAG: VWA domain-containing protein [Luteolibacter sp.]
MRRDENAPHDSLRSHRIAGCPLQGRESGPPETDSPPVKNRVQIALLLDTSNSMDGLIDQAKTQLWKVVNTFTDAKRDGEAPRVEVALYEYGNNSLSVDNQWVRQVQPLSGDLDSISKSLFSLRTNGGEEYCGAVIQRSLSDLRWDDSKDTYKVIFIAGNEPFTQGPVDARKACKAALEKGVTINTIHCGSREEGMAGSWHDGAALGGGKFMVINQDRAVVSISAPQDKQISDLGIELNKTYLGYGKERVGGAARQQEADGDAAANAKSGAGVNRAVTKAGGNYRNGSWDLVDATRDKAVDPAKIADADLPEAMRGMKPEDRAAYIEKAAKERAAIQEKIIALNREREAFVAEEMKKQATKGDKTLDEALVETTREQAGTRGYTFGK